MKKLCAFLILLLLGVFTACSERTCATPECALAQIEIGDGVGTDSSSCTPECALAQIKIALTKHDAILFQQYVDIDAVILRTLNQHYPPWGGASSDSEHIAPAIAGQFREAAISFIETGVPPVIPGISGNAIDMFDDLRITAPVLLERGEGGVTMGATLAVCGESVPIRFFMRNMGHLWQVVEVDDAANMLHNLFSVCVENSRKQTEAQRQANPDQALELPGLNPDAALPLTLSYIPAGKFMMGSLPNEEGRRVEEGPRHKVHITQPFWMGKYEVTNAQFGAFVQATGYVTDAEKNGYGYGWNTAQEKFTKTEGLTWCNLGKPGQGDGGPNDPVCMVSWNDAVAFCAWASEATGKRIALPTEAQWEYACRAGGTTRFWWGDAIEDGCEHANVMSQEHKGRTGFQDDWTYFPCEDHFEERAPVGQFTPNAWGLHDMVGNAREWCADWYAPDYYAQSPLNDPQGPEKGDLRVVRGVGWRNFSPLLHRSASRYYPSHPEFAKFEYGFRVVYLP